MKKKRKEEKLSKKKEKKRKNVMYKKNMQVKDVTEKQLRAIRMVSYFTS